MRKARITNIQHFNVHDGPGIRTVVFYQGCPMRCKWCQNPEAISVEVGVMYNRELCIGCAACLEACKQEAMFFDHGILRTDEHRCIRCGNCEKACYAGARTLTSKTMSVDEVFTEVMKDEVVYHNSGGGITISGGEPLLHIEFNTELLQRCREIEISTAVETTGNVPCDYLDQISRYVDTYLYDFKLYDNVLHQHWVGTGNSRIKSNLQYLCRIHSNVVIRIPLIPSVNDTEKEFFDMMEFVKGLDHINSVHILPFHNFGANKYAMLGQDYEMWNFREDNAERQQRCREIAESFGFRVSMGGTGFADDKKVIKK